METGKIVNNVGKAKSNNLNEFAKVKNKHIVIPCLTIGIVIFLKVCHPLAPSI